MPSIQNLTAPPSPHVQRLALVVDDKSSNRSILKSLLEESNYRVTEAVNGKQALEHFNTEQPDIIFMDVEMPVMNGHDAAIHIRKIKTHRFVPIIFLTNTTDEQSLAKCIEVGGDDFISKPFSHAVLKAKMHAMERIRDLHNEVSQLYSQMQKDQEMAETVFNRVVTADNVALDTIQTLLRPAAMFSGDVLLSAYAPSRDINILLGDFTGHGLAAALGALPASETFRAMTGKGFSPYQILSGINKKLHNLLPTGMFFALQFVSISHNLEYMTVCNCGMPDMLLLDGTNGSIKQRFSSNSLPLGITTDINFQGLFEHVKINQGDHILLVSDGALEARDPDNNYFGKQRLELAIEKPGDQRTALESIAVALGEFCQEAPQDDDISLAEIPCIAEILPTWDTHSIETESNIPTVQKETEELGDTLEFTIHLSGSRLRQADPIPLIINHIQEMEGLHSHRRLLFTILTELYVNALDHGVLNLDSSLKRSPEGFTRYFTEREQLLGQLSKGFVNIHIRTQNTASGGRMTIQVEDSGNGFDFESYLADLDPSDTGLSGRGILLVRELCKSVHYESPGNKVVAIYTWTEK